MKLKANFTGFNLTKDKVYDVIFEYDTVYELKCDTGTYCRNKDFFEIINCNECQFINLTESQQINNKDYHICLKHNERLFHRSNNPKIKHEYIYPCDKCNGNDFKSRDEF